MKLLRNRCIEPIASLLKFKAISVRDVHTFNGKRVNRIEPRIVCDPVVLSDFMGVQM